MTEEEAIKLAKHIGDDIVKHPIRHDVHPGHGHGGLRLIIWKPYSGVRVSVIHGIPLVLIEMFERLCEVQWRAMLKTLEERWPTK